MVVALGDSSDSDEPFLLGLIGAFDELVDVVSIAFRKFEAAESV